MTCIQIQKRPNGFLCVDDSPDFKIRVGARVFDFEWHRWFGPIALNKNGSPRDVQPKAFLQAAQWWDEQGRGMDAEGFCVWKKPDPHEGLNMVHIGGRHWMVVPDGRDAQEYKREQLTRLGLDADRYMEDSATAREAESDQGTQDE